MDKLTYFIDTATLQEWKEFVIYIDSFRGTDSQRVVDLVDSIIQRAKEYEVVK